MTVHLLKANFSRGEVSEKIYSRVDVDWYDGGVAKVRNFFPTSYGGVRRRSGTRYIGGVKTGDKPIRFVPFVFDSTGQAYVLEFGHTYIRFWSNGGQLVSGMSPVEVATPYEDSEIWGIQFAQFGDTLIIVHPDHPPQRLVRASHTSWSISDVPFSDGPYLPINDQDNTVSWSALPTKGATITFTHSSTNGVNGGSGFLSTDVGRLYRLQTLGVWVWGVIDAVNSSTEIDVDILGSQIISPPAGVTGWSSVTGTAVAGASVHIQSNAIHNVKATDIGSVFAAALLDGSSRYVKIEQLDAANRLVVTVIGSVSSDIATSLNWRLGAFSETTGYPRCVSFFDGRLVFASTQAEPRTIYFSRANFPYVFAPSESDGTVTAANSFYPAILASRSDRILWLVESVRLQIGLSSGILTMGSEDAGSGFGPTNFNQRPEISNGASPVTPVKAADVTIFPEKFGLNLRNVYFSFEQNTLVGPKFTTPSDHLFKDGIAELAYQQVPEPVIWVRTSTGDLRGVTYNREERIVGFHRHDLGGSSGSSVETMTVIPGLNRDELWLCVSREIDGNLVKYVEVLEADFENQAQEDAFFVDCGLSYDGSPTATVSGLSHLEGEEVSILADGYVCPNVVVDSGAITLPNGAIASKIHIGLPIVSEVKLLRWPHNQKDGSTLGRPQRVSSTITEVIRTAGLQIGIEGYSTQPIRFRHAEDPMDAPIPLVSGGFQGFVEDTWENGGQIYYYTNDPSPAYIRSVLVGLEVEGS